MFNKTITVLDEYGKAVVKQAQDNLDEKGFDGQKRDRKKSNTGALKKSLGYSIRQTDGEIIISFKSSKDYAAIVEEGRDKGSKMPPSGVINRWAIQRNIKGVRNKRGQFTSRKSTVYAIRKSIAKRGIKPVRYFSGAMLDVFTSLPEKLQLSLVDDLQNIIYEDMTKKGFNAKIT